MPYGPYSATFDSLPSVSVAVTCACRRDLEMRNFASSTSPDSLTSSSSSNTVQGSVLLPHYRTLQKFSLTARRVVQFRRTNIWELGSTYFEKCV